MTMEYKDGVVIMSLMDLEHCGFSHDDFDFELSARGIDQEEARWPVALVVNFAGGHVLFRPVADGVEQEREEARRQFQALLRALLDGRE